ncbi:MAG: hypothetical protein N3G20_12395, partial [Verrucomicrobiae bacterium]|nr:hypothetical protein [Verrucomicrobiae bacterium]
GQSAVHVIALLRFWPHSALVISRPRPGQRRNFPDTLIRAHSLKIPWHCHYTNRENFSTPKTSHAPPIRQTKPPVAFIESATTNP